MLGQNLKQRIYNSPKNIVTKPQKTLGQNLKQRIYIYIYIYITAQKNTGTKPETEDITAQLRWDKTQNAGYKLKTLKQSRKPKMLR